MHLIKFISFFLVSTLLNCNNAHTKDETPPETTTEHHSVIDPVPPTTTKCEIRLFENGHRVSDYYDKIEQLRKHPIGPCTLLFSNKSIDVSSSLSQGGGASILFKTTNGKILRITANKAQENDLKHFIVIYNELHNYGIPVVPTYDEGVAPERLEYLIHDFIPIRYSLRGFLNSVKNPGDLTNSTEFKSFVKFCSHLYRFEFVDDLHGGNIVIAKNGDWLVLDIGSSSERQYTENRGLLYKFYHTPEDVQTLFKEKIPGYSMPFFGWALTDPKPKSFEHLVEELEEKSFFNQATRNPITDPDPTMLDYIKTPEKWHRPIRLAILKERYPLLIVQSDGSFKGANLAIDGYAYSQIQNQEQSIYQIEVDPNRFASKIANAKTWNEPKTTSQYVEANRAFGGINGGFWSKPDEGYWQGKIMGKLGAEGTPVPSATLKTPEGLLTDTQSFWGAFGWSLKHPDHILSEYLAVQWKVNIKGQELPINKVDYQYFSTEQFLFWRKSGQNSAPQKHFKWYDPRSWWSSQPQQDDTQDGKVTKYTIQDNHIKKVEEVSIINENRGTIFVLESTQKPNLSVNDSISFSYHFQQPRNNMHDDPNRDESNSSTWASMDYIMSGKLLIRHGEVQIINKEEGMLVGGYGAPFAGSRPKSSLCIKENKMWLFTTTVGVTIEELIDLLVKKTCKEVLLLDGGDSTALIVNGKNVMGFKERHISDAVIFERHRE